MFQIAGDDRSWSCVGESVLDVLLEMERERDKKQKVVREILPRVYPRNPVVFPGGHYSCLSSCTGTSSCSMEISTLSIRLTSQSSSCTEAQNRTLSKQLMTHQIQDLHSRAPLTQAVYRYRLCFSGVVDFPLHGNGCPVRL